MSGTEIILECGRPGCNETFNTGRSLWAAAAIEGREAGWDTDSNPEVCPAHIAARLEYLRSQIQAECISYSELSELQALAAHIDAGDTELLEWAGVPEDAPFIKGGALESTNPPVPAPLKYLAARQALKSYGADYARYIENSIDELLAKGIDVRHQTLGESLAGNDGD
jgi:hypothetical protein